MLGNKIFIKKITRSVEEFFKKNKLVLAGFGLAILLNLFLWLLIGYRFRFTNDFIPLRYDIYFGVNSIGHWTKLFKLPLIGLVIIIINLICFLLFNKKEKIMNYFLVLASLIVQCVLVLEGILVINL